ncbi:MAG: deoxyguanosinetriphosphate triphosphohydrolase [Verrucomicrobiota bacterium]
MEWEKKEKLILAPYAVFSEQTRGRRYPEKNHTRRSEFQRDRDRIVHSMAFRRLEYKTQVVPNGTGDHFRTRLTHTMEVAVIARSVARSLSLNEDLTEAIALAHDLGHPPFGHPGEDALNEVMKDHGGFEHNRQSLRVVEELESKYPEFTGLNLTAEVREGLELGHKSTQPGDMHPSLEAQVTDFADEIAYCCHDLDDALDSNLISSEMLSEVLLWQEIDAREQLCHLHVERYRRYLIRCLIDLLVEDLCEQSLRNLSRAKPANAHEAQYSDQRLIAFSADMRPKLQNLRKFLYQNFYYHPKISRMKDHAALLLKELFQFFCEHPEKLGEKFKSRIDTEGLHRTVCDYLAGMTDRYALQQYNKHFGSNELLKEIREGINITT